MTWDLAGVAIDSAGVVGGTELTAGALRRFSRLGALVERDHAKAAARICKPRQTAVLSNGSHHVVLMNARQSSITGIAARPPARVHFSAAAAEANDIASATVSLPPMGKA